jgi:hypothetical protein
LDFGDVTCGRTGAMSHNELRAMEPVNCVQDRCYVNAKCS